jgi:hypothetical protein
MASCSLELCEASGLFGWCSEPLWSLLTINRSQDSIQHTYCSLVVVSTVSSRAWAHATRRGVEEGRAGSHADLDADADADADADVDAG